MAFQPAWTSHSKQGVASEKKHSFIITHKMKSKQFEHLTLEVLMEKSAFVALQKPTQELERLRGLLHDAIQALEIEDQ